MRRQTPLPPPPPSRAQKRYERDYAEYEGVERFAGVTDDALRHAYVYWWMGATYWHHTGNLAYARRTLSLVLREQRRRGRVHANGATRGMNPAAPPAFARRPRVRKQPRE